MCTGETVMKDDYKKMYLHLFNAVTDALELLPEDNRAAQLLRTAQMVCEELYIQQGEEEGGKIVRFVK